VRRRSPAGILRWLSDAMLSQQTEEIGRFCTIACLHLDLSRSPTRVTVACGGHPMPIVVRADGRTEEIGVAGTLLGLVEEPDLQDRAATLHEGDAVVLYTDGLSEAGAPARVWTPDELAAVASRAAGEPAAALVERLLEAAVGPLSSVRDDVAVLALRSTG
jgi:serine phosphatase RsbU (regulator of sigma subunit)